jgi:hypothetical protein
MKKSQLIKIIRESVKELMTEQGPNDGTHTYVRMMCCGSGCPNPSPINWRGTSGNYLPVYSPNYPFTEIGTWPTSTACIRMEDNSGTPVLTSQGPLNVTYQGLTYIVMGNGNATSPYCTPPQHNIKVNTTMRTCSITISHYNVC